jgi:nucleotide-binding universal stress UspA family protein
MKPMKTILHPTDFSECAMRALSLAGSLARDRYARLILLHVVPKAAPGGQPEAGAQTERRLWDLQTYGQEMAERLRRLDVPAVPCAVERLVEEGEPAEAILRKAAETACDLIVMGTHGRSGEIRRLMGSVAEAVTREAYCPVVTVALPARAAAERPAGQEAGAAL